MINFEFNFIPSIYSHLFSFFDHVHICNKIKQINQSLALTPPVNPGQAAQTYISTRALLGNSATAKATLEG